MSKTLTFALLATGLLLAGAAIPAMAERGDDNRGPRDRDHPEDGNQTLQDGEHRKRGRGNGTDDHPRFERLMALCSDNETLNASMEKRCDRLHDIHNHTMKARREAHALLGAIAAMERRLDRMNATLDRLENATADGNATGNETGNVTKKIERLEDHIERALERLAHLKERLEALHAKWAEVREHVAERRHHGMRGGDDGDGNETEESDAAEAADDDAGEADDDADKDAADDAEDDADDADEDEGDDDADDLDEDDGEADGNETADP